MYIIQKRPGDQIKLGRKGEYNARCIALDLSAWQARYGDDGTVQLLYQRPGDATPYPVPLTREDHLAFWTVAAADTANSGNSGRAELRYYVGDALVKSAISQVVVEPSLGEPGDAPDEKQQSWLDQAVQAGTTAQTSAAAAANSAQSAQSSAESASSSAQSAQISAESAAASAQGIQTAEESAAASASAAEVSAQSAVAHVQAAQNAANQATTSAAAAEASAQSSSISAQSAETSAQSAQSAAESAANSAQSAQTSAESAAASASAAEASAQSIVASTQSAQSAVNQATTSAAAAEASAQSAATSAQSAQKAADETNAALDALVDDAVVDSDTLWSSGKIIDYLCIEFETLSYGSSGIACNPVPGSKINVRTSINSNPSTSGTPTPTQSIPLQGWNNATVTLTAGTNSASHELDFGCTVYGGTMNWVTGVLTVKDKILCFDGTEDWQTRYDGSAYHPTLSIEGISPNPDRTKRSDEKCSHYVFCTGETLDGHTTGFCTTSDGIEFYNSNYVQADPAAWKDCLATLNANGDPVHVVVRLNEPYTVQLEPTQIVGFEGKNTLKCSLGNLTISGMQDFRYELQQIKEAIKALQS